MFSNSGPLSTVNCCLVLLAERRHHGGSDGLDTPPLVVTRSPAPGSSGAPLHTCCAVQVWQLVVSIDICRPTLMLRHVCTHKYSQSTYQPTKEMLTSNCTAWYKQCAVSCTSIEHGSWINKLRGKIWSETLLGRLDKRGSIYRVRTYRGIYCWRIVSNARGFPPTILNKSLISPTPVKFRAHFILGYQTRLEVNYYLRSLVSERCGLLLWSTTWLFPPSAQSDRQTTACLSDHYCKYVHTVNRAHPAVLSLNERWKVV